MNNKGFIRGTLKTTEKYCRLKSGTGTGTQQNTPQEDRWAKAGKLIELIRKGQ